MRPKPLVLIVMDGWGISPIPEGNAPLLAPTPVYDHLLKNYPAAALKASGIDVGLSWGEVGNSEVGHQNLGSGQVVYQNLPRITLAIQDGSFFANRGLLSAISQVHRNNSSLHLMGILGNGGVHGHSDHLFALLDLAAKEGVKAVYLHIFTDGRDAPPKSAPAFLAELENKMRITRLGEIATVAGRYYAMDRNNHWDRTAKAYFAITEGKGLEASSASEAIENSYKKNIFDEELLPTVIKRRGQPVATVKEGDAVIFFNFRPDRARQLTKMFVLPTFSKIERPFIRNLAFVTMTEYEENLPITAIAFPPIIITNTFGKIISDAGLAQLHIAETEKYAHVTYYFNYGQEKPYPGEDQILVPSPEVASYDLKPEMSAYKIADIVIKAIQAKKYDFIIVNFANPDMVGHTGNLQAAMHACTAVDSCIGKIVQETYNAGGETIITADHGNCEEMIDIQTGEIIKEHSNNPVPCIHVGLKNRQEKEAALIEQVLTSPIGVLADVSPTMLDIMGLQKPKEMEGVSLKNSFI